MLCCVVTLHEVYRACFGLRRDEEQSRQAFEKGRREIYYSPSASSQTGWHSLGKATGRVFDLGDPEQHATSLPQPEPEPEPESEPEPQPEPEPEPEQQPDDDDELSPTAEAAIRAHSHPSGLCRNGALMVSNSRAEHWLDKTPPASSLEPPPGVDGDAATSANSLIEFSCVHADCVSLF